MSGQETELNGFAVCELLFRDEKLGTFRSNGNDALNVLNELLKINGERHLACHVKGRNHLAEESVYANPNIIYITDKRLFNISVLDMHRYLLFPQLIALEA